MKSKPSKAHSPVGRAVAKKAMADALVEMHKHLTRVSVAAYLAADGEPEPVLLGHLALMLGIGAEIGMNRAPSSPETRRMHAALRTVLGMSVNGGRWLAAQAKILHEAAVLSVKAFEEHSALGIAMMAGAYELSTAVRLGTARMNDVAGPEIYRASNESTLETT